MQFFICENWLPEVAQYFSNALLGFYQSANFDYTNFGCVVTNRNILALWLQNNKESICCRKLLVKELLYLASV